MNAQFIAMLRFYFVTASVPILLWLTFSYHYLKQHEQHLVYHLEIKNILSTISA